MTLSHLYDLLLCSGTYRRDALELNALGLSMNLIIECYSPSLARYYCYLFSLRQRQCSSRSGA